VDDAMKRSALLLLVFLSVAPGAFADDGSATAVLSFQRYDFDSYASSGFRQTYDLRLSRALTTTSIVQLMFRGDDYRGTTDRALAGEDDFESRQLQPIAEYSLNAEALHISARSDYLDVDTTYAGIVQAQTLQRSNLRADWSPRGLPRLSLFAQRNSIDDDAGTTALTEQGATLLADYAWRGFTVSGDGRYSSAVDPAAGYDRRTNGLGAAIGYSAAPMGGRVTFSAQANGRLTDFREQTTSDGSSIPVPVAISRTFYAVDETPADGRDQPLASYPSLRDGNLDASTGISVGPESVSFLNLAGDLARTETVDEVRVVIRDPSGNPPRTGGGSVTWDAYSSIDGQVWTPLSATSTYNAALAYYSVTFAPVELRWLKVVSFGVNSESSFVTELEFYRHIASDEPQSRDGSERLVDGVATVSWRAGNRTTLSYTGVYNYVDQERQGFATYDSTAIEHVIGIEQGIARSLSARGQFTRRDAESGDANDTLTVATTFLDYTPTRRLRTSLELTRQEQDLIGSGSTSLTRALHFYGQIYRAWTATAVVGQETQDLRDASSSQRTFFNLTSGAQLYRTLRLQLTASLQQVDSDSTDPAVLLLGPQKDRRVAAEFIWRAGRPLLLATRFGWVDSEALSGFTQRYRIDWRPFADGAITLGGTWNEDIDPMTNRRSRRVIFTPRWIINGWAAFDLNYTAVSTRLAERETQQKTLFATLTLTR
jgi:hypothetical protein